MVDRRSFSQKKRAEICLRQGGKCGCGEKLRHGQYEIDHIAALIHGGSNEDDNLRAICLDCHKAKTRKDVQGRAHHDRIAVGGKQRRGPPMPGSRASNTKKHMDGTTSFRRKRCDGCGQDWADPPSKLCPCCQAYNANIGHF